MAAKAENPNQLEEHRRKLFVQNMNPRTTERSLREYFSEFSLKNCMVLTKEGKKKKSTIDCAEKKTSYIIRCISGSNRGHGFIVFDKESHVNKVMNRRPHTIDGQKIELYRSIPDQGPLKETKSITKLIVSNFPKRAISESDLRRYFARYGDIESVQMTDEGNAYCIEFDE